MDFRALLLQGRDCLKCPGDDDQDEEEDENEHDEGYK